MTSWERRHTGCSYLHDSSSVYSFPRADVRGIEIANSFRLGNPIAGLASTFAMSAVNPSGLVGLRTHDSSPTDNCIFLFQPEDTDLVLPAYAAHLETTIPGELLKSGTFSAIGEVHKSDEEPLSSSDSQFPKNLRHYWADYGKSKATSSQAKDLIGACYRARGIVLTSGSVAPALDEVAKALIRILNKRPDVDRISIRSRPHRQLVEFITLSGEDAERYQEEICKILFVSTSVSQGGWESFVSKTMTLLLPTFEVDVHNSYLAWRAETNDDGASPITRTVGENEFIWSGASNVVKIKVGTIHSVKGETHTATLVVETFKRAHFFKRLLPWLTRRKVNAMPNTQDADLKRLALAYVAFTRPTHVLCVAMLASSLGEGSTKERNLALLSESGWAVKLLSRAAS